MSDDYYFDQQAADDAAYEAKQLANEAEYIAAHTPTPVQQAASVQESTPVQQAASVQESTPAYVAPVQQAAPVNQWEQTVNDIYQQTFGRQADAGGMASFTAALNSGMTGEQMRAALASSAEGQSMGLAPAAPTGIASLPAAAKPAQWELQPESYDEFTGAYNAPYYIDVNSGATKAVGQPVQATGLTPVDPNTLAQHVGPNFQGTPTQFYDDKGNLKGVLVDAVRAGLNTREGELILDPMSLGLALKPGETASLNSALQQRNEQGQLLFIDPNTGKTTIYNTGVPAETGSTVKDLLYINERKYGGQIPADTAQGMLLLASMALTGGVGGALMNAAGLGAGAGLTAAEAAALMGGTLSEAGAASMLGGQLASQGVNWNAIASSAAKSAATNAGMTAIRGGKPSDIFKSGLIGAVSGGAGSAVGDLGLGSLETTLAKAGLQAGITGLTGGNVANSLIASAVGAALPVALDKFIPEGTFDGLPSTIKNALTSATASAVTAAATGGNISDAALNSILSSAGSAATDYVADATGFKGLTFEQSLAKIGGYFKSDDLASSTEGELGFAGSATPPKGSASNSSLSDQLFKDVFGTPSTTPSTTTPAQNNAPFDLDTGYRAESFPVAAPRNAEFVPLEAGPLDKETQAQVNAIAAKQQQKNYSSGLNAKLSNANSIINLVPDTLGWLTGVGKSIEAEIKAATSSLANSTEYTRPTDAQISKIFQASQDLFAPIRDLVFDATQVDAASPEAKSGLITKTLNGINDIMHSAAVPIAEATGMPIEYVTSILSVVGPKIAGKTFNVASAVGKDMAGGGWSNAFSNVISKAEDLGITPKTKSYFIDPDQGLGSLGKKPYAESNGGISSLLDDMVKKSDADYRAAQAKTPNAQLLDTLLKPEELTKEKTPGALTLEQMLNDLKKPVDTAPATVKPPVKSTTDNVATGAAKETKSTTPAVSFPDTREVLTPEKIQSLAPPAPPAPPKPPATTTTTAPTTPTPVRPATPVTPTTPTTPTVVKPTAPVVPITPAVPAEVKPTTPAAVRPVTPTTPAEVKPTAPTTPAVPAKVTEPVKPVDLGSTALMKQLEDQMAVYEKSGMTRDEATNKAVTDLAKSTATSVSGLQKSLTDTIAANEKSGLTRDQATNKAITDLAKSTGTSDAELKALIGTTAAAGQTFTQTQVAGLQKSLTDTIAANEKSGLTRDAATNKAIADLAKSTGTSDAELKKLIGATSAANQTFTKDQVDGLQKTLTDTIAANEAAGMKRTEATDKAIKELATQTKLKDDDLRKLITTTFDTGQKYTKEQIDLLEKAIGKQITGVETGITDLSTTFQSYLADQAKAEAAKQKQAKMGQVAAQRSQTQQVSAKTPPGAVIDYLYDIGGESIFAPTVGSKKQQKESYYDMYDGGLIDDASSIDDLYNMLRSK